jgi:hypothetical protein
MEISEVRRRVRSAIEEARREAAARRERADAAVRDYEAFLAGRAVPVFQQFASALQGEGFRFRVETPADSVRLTADGSDDHIELVLDRTLDPPRVVGRSSRGRGRRQVVAERPVRDAAVADLTDADVLDYLAEEIRGFVER